jgi:hypothetical protein
LLISAMATLNSLIWRLQAGRPVLEKLPPRARHEIKTFCRALLYEWAPIGQTRCLSHDLSAATNAIFHRLAKKQGDPFENGRRHVFTEPPPARAAPQYGY